MKKSILILFGLMAFAGRVQAADVQAQVYQLTEKGRGQSVGTISFKDTKNGLSVQEDFQNLPAGAHGIHVHENGDCGHTVVDGQTVLGGAAGGHYDPHQTGKHTGPNSHGHKGDLPVLSVEPTGRVSTSFVLTGVNSDDFKGRTVIIHAGGDNYSDTPQPLGGGGQRIACGVIK